MKVISEISFLNGQNSDVYEIFFRLLSSSLSSRRENLIEIYSIRFGTNYSHDFIGGVRSSKEVKTYAVTYDESCGRGTRYFYIDDKEWEMIDSNYKVARRLKNIDVVLS